MSAAGILGSVTWAGWDQAPLLYGNPLEFKPVYPVGTKEIPVILNFGPYILEQSFIARLNNRDISHEFRVEANTHSVAFLPLNPGRNTLTISIDDLSREPVSNKFTLVVQK